MAEIPTEPHRANTTRLTNVVRAGVLGANDGIVSIAGLVLGVAGATTSRAAIATAGLAGMVAAALSMGVGEYVSVSAQRDTERALLAQEARELREDPVGELAELAGIYEEKGLPPQLAREVAEALTERSAFAAHAEAELGINPHALVSPWAAAWSSMISFVLGAMLPLIAILLPSTPGPRVPVTVAAVLVALALTGTVSARLSGAKVRTAVLRIMVGGALAMAITYAIGRAIGVAV